MEYGGFSDGAEINISVSKEHSAMVFSKYLHYFLAIGVSSAPVSNLAK